MIRAFIIRSAFLSCCSRLFIDLSTRRAPGGPRSNKIVDAQMLWRQKQLLLGVSSFAHPLFMSASPSFLCFRALATRRVCVLQARPPWGTEHPKIPGRRLHWTVSLNLMSWERGFASLTTGCPLLWQETWLALCWPLAAFLRCQVRLVAFNATSS